MTAVLRRGGLLRPSCERGSWSRRVSCSPPASVAPEGRYADEPAGKSTAGTGPGRPAPPSRAEVRAARPLPEGTADARRRPSDRAGRARRGRHPATITVRKGIAWPISPSTGPCVRSTAGDDRQRWHARESSGVARSRPAAGHSLAAEERPARPPSRGDCQEPAILLLDDRRHLDIGHQLRLLRVARRGLRREGVGVLAVVHEPYAAPPGAERLVLLAGGGWRPEGLAAAVRAGSARARARGHSTWPSGRRKDGRPARIPFRRRSRLPAADGPRSRNLQVISDAQLG